MQPTTIPGETQCHCIIRQNFTETQITRLRLKTLIVATGFPGVSTVEPTPGFETDRPFKQLNRGINPLATKSGINPLATKEKHPSKRANLSFCRGPARHAVFMQWHWGLSRDSNGVVMRTGHDPGVNPVPTGIVASGFIPRFERGRDANRPRSRGKPGPYRDRSERVLSGRIPLAGGDPLSPSFAQGFLLRSPPYARLRRTSRDARDKTRDKSAGRRDSLLAK